MKISILNGILFTIFNALLKCQVLEERLFVNVTCSSTQKFTFRFGSAVKMNTTYDLLSAKNTIKEYTLIKEYAITENEKLNLFKIGRVFQNETAEFEELEKEHRIIEKEVSEDPQIKQFWSKLEFPLTKFLIVEFKNNESNKKYSMIFYVKESADPTKDLKYLLNLISLTGSEKGIFTFVDHDENLTSYFLRAIDYFPTIGTKIPGTEFDELTHSAVNVFRSNCLIRSQEITQEELLYNKSFYLNLISYNWPFWYMIICILGFMMISNFVDEHSEYKIDMKDNYLTYYPLYSMFIISSEVIFTPRIRMAIFMFVLASIGWFNALMVYLYIELDEKADISYTYRLALFPFCSAIFSLFFAFLGGLLATFYYNSHRHYVNIVKKLDSFSEKEVALEEYEMTSFFRLHIFYFVIGFVGLFFFILPIWFLYFKNLENQGYWLLMVVIGFAWKYLVFDILVLLLGKFEVLTELLKLGGYWFDYDLHAEFKEIYKIS